MKDYLIKNNLVDSKNLKLCETYVPTNARKLTHESLVWYEAEIVLCSSIKMAQHRDYIKFGLKKEDEDSFYWDVYVWWTDDQSLYYEEHPIFDIMYKTIMMLLPYMAGSNVTYLAEGMKYDF